MLAYLFIALSPLAVSVFFPKLKTDEKSKKKFLIISGIILILFIGLRSKYVGSLDSINYFNMMKRAGLHDSWQSWYDPDYVEGGFQFFCFLLSRVFTNPQWLFVFTAAFYILSISYFIYKNSDNCVLSMVMYITLGLMQFHMQGMRQSIAMCLCLFAYEFLKKDKTILFFLTILIATQIHRTVIVFFILYIFSKLPYRWWSMILVVIISALIWLFSSDLTVFANDVFETEYIGSAAQSGGFVATAIHLLIILFAMLFNPTLKKDKALTLSLFTCMICTTLYLTRYFSTMIAERLSFYFTFAELVLLPNTISHLPKEYKKIITVGVYALSIALFLYRLRGSDFIPYHFFWN